LSGGDNSLLGSSYSNGDNHGLKRRLDSDYFDDGGEQQQQQPDAKLVRHFIAHAFETQTRLILQARSRSAESTENLNADSLLDFNDY